jgi:hypothetical protein
VWASFDGIIYALDKEAESEDAKTRVKAKNLLEAVKCFEFILALMFMRNVMSKTKILTKQVQAIELNIADALEAHDATINTLKYLVMFFEKLTRACFIQIVLHLITYTKRFHGKEPTMK